MITVTNITNKICKTCDGRCCKGCKYFNKKSGCTLDYEHRYLSCKLYPFIDKDKELYLDVKCPGWKVFGEMYDDALEIRNQGGGVI